jgi:voltage-gated potassium channel
MRETEMTGNPLVWFGLAGLPPDDNPRALEWQRRLHWWMVACALLSVPAYVLDTAEQHPSWQRYATVIDVLILVAFTAELAWMARLTRSPLHYLANNWLNLVVVVGAAAALFGSTTEWVALARLARVAVAGTLLIRVFAQFRFLFTRRGAPVLVGTSALLLLLFGAMFYWLDPNITSYWDGLWLAFITGATVGYGDLVPTTGPARLVAVFVTLVGWALLSLFTASVVTAFIGREETLGRQLLHREIVQLRRDLANLLTEEEMRARGDLHRDLLAMRAQISRMLEVEGAAHSRSLSEELSALRREVAELRAIVESERPRTSR